MKNNGMGLLIDYMYCTGCHRCEVACKTEHDLPEGIFGIRLANDEPFQIDKDIWEYKWVPIPTQLCDQCEDRQAKGKVPSCVLHCCAHCIEYGDMEELAKKAKGMGRTVLYSV